MLSAPENPPDVVTCMSNTSPLTGAPLAAVRRTKSTRVGVDEQALGSILGEKLRPRCACILNHGGILCPSDAADSGAGSKANGRVGIVLDFWHQLEKVGVHARCRPTRIEGAVEGPSRRGQLKWMHIGAKHAAHPIPQRQLEANGVRVQAFLQGRRLFHFQCLLPFTSMISSFSVNDSAERPLHCLQVDVKMSPTQNTLSNDHRQWRPNAIKPTQHNRTMFMAKR